MSSTAAQGRTSWLQPERNWKGPRALVPVETCYQILQLFLWVTSLLSLVSATVAFWQSSHSLRTNPVYWTIVACQSLVILAAIFRGWPFVVRAIVLLAALAIFYLGAAMVVGLTPNLFFLVIFLVSAGSLFFGARVGFILTVGLLAAQALIGWGWVTGRLPAFQPDMSDTQRFTDMTSGRVWVRLILIGFGLQAGLVLLMRHVLRDLNDALLQANKALHKLAVEQEYRARAEEARLKAELAVRESQKFDALGRMASGVAHDFNNALCVMKGWSSLVLEESRDPLVREAMGDIKRATDNAAQLTHHLLAFSRHDPVKREITNLAEAVQLEARTLRRLLPPDIEISAETGAAVHVRLARGQLQEVVLNLAINARDAMPGGGKLAFRVKAISTAGPDAQPAGQYACFSITDTGTGMDPATQAHIFEPFFTTKAAGKGTGLGLAMVYGIVSGAGGWIEVNSAPRRGTTFTIYLPAVAASEIHLAPPVTRILNPTRCRVLIVDGQHEISALIERILTREGFPVIAVANGTEALAAMEGPAGRFGLLITEGVLSGAPASEVIERALLVDPDCRVVVATAHLPDQLLQRGIEAGSYFLLAKPFETSQLREVVNEAIGRKAGATTPAGVA